MAAIFDLPVTPTSKILYISSSVLLDPENVGVAVGISLLSCIQAEIFVMHMLVRLMAAIFGNPAHAGVEEYSH